MSSDRAQRAGVVVCLQPKSSNGRHVPLETTHSDNRRPKQSEQWRTELSSRLRASATENV